MNITDEMVLAAARSDALFDGRDFDAMVPKEQRMYRGRSLFALQAAMAAAPKDDPITTVNVMGTDATMLTQYSAAKAAYYRHTENHPTIHCNRVPTWDEISADEKRKWVLFSAATEGRNDD